MSQPGGELVTAAGSGYAVETIEEILAAGADPNEQVSSGTSLCDEARDWRFLPSKKHMHCTRTSPTDTVYLPHQTLT